MVVACARRWARESPAHTRRLQRTLPQLCSVHWLQVRACRGLRPGLLLRRALGW